MLVSRAQNRGPNLRVAQSLWNWNLQFHR